MDAPRYSYRRDAARAHTQHSPRSWRHRTTHVPVQHRSEKSLPHEGWGRFAHKNESGFPKNCAQQRVLRVRSRQGKPLEVASPTSATQRGRSGRLTVKPSSCRDSTPAPTAVRGRPQNPPQITRRCHRFDRDDAGPAVRIHSPSMHPLATTVSSRVMVQSSTPSWASTAPVFAPADPLVRLDGETPSRPKYSRCRRQGRSARTGVTLCHPRRLPP